jgi:hypothetical protein
VQRRRAYVGGGLQPGAALVVVRLAVVTLPPRSTAPAVVGCRLVGCSVVSRRPLRSRAESQRVCVGPGPVLASHAPATRSSEMYHSPSTGPDTPSRAACRVVGAPKYGESRNGVLRHHHGRDARASPPASAAAAWRGQGLVPIAGWNLGGVGPDRGLRGGGRRWRCEE